MAMSLTSSFHTPKLPSDLISRTNTVDKFKQRDRIFNKKTTKTIDLTMQLPDVDHVKNYIIPRGEIQRLGIPEISSVRNKAKYSYIDQVCKNKKIIPSP